MQRSLVVTSVGALAVVGAMVLASCKTREDSAMAKSYDGGLPGVSCAVTQWQPSGTTTSLAGADLKTIDRIDVVVPARDVPPSQANASILVYTGSLLKEEISVKNLAFDWYDRAGRLGLVSGGVQISQDPSAQSLPKATVTYRVFLNSTAGDSSGFVDIADSRATPAVTATGTLTCK